VVETTCQPVLEDHDSRRPERKRRFLLATLVTKPFAFVFDCSGEIILPRIFINRSHEPDTPTKVYCLLLPSRALLISRCVLLVGAIFVYWESTGIIFEIGIICVECIIFKIGIICVECIIFKIRIICGISFDNFASSFDLST
jgi:hypothetical protein